QNPPTSTRSQQPPRILVVDIRPPHWAHTSHRLCDALENVFSLACGLAGPPRIPLFSLYVAQNQQECLLPFVPVRGCFSRLQRCIAELRSFAAEGASRAGQDVLSRAVQDGLQQFKQYTGQGLAGASRCGSSVEVSWARTFRPFLRGAPCLFPHPLYALDILVRHVWLTMGPLFQDGHRSSFERRLSQSGG
uniref:Uncharacterized protein n=1 Tax=Varanus komodoensis TaxID=61221 RepID=A0A8D2L8D0_VARKO